MSKDQVNEKNFIIKNVHENTHFLKEKELKL